MIQELEKEFKAVSDRNRTMYNRYDENGVFSMTCSRHGIPLRLYDIYRGEGRKYALASVAHVLNTRQPQQPLSIMYDIACLCKSCLEATFPLLKSEDTRYAVPIFHAYAHNIHCQLEYNPRYIAGFGLTDGEGTERFWSYMNGFASMTRSMTSSNRHLVLTDAASHFNEAKMSKLPRMISRKFQSCNKQLLMLEMSEEKFLEQEELWKKKVELLSYPGKKVSSVHAFVDANLAGQDDPLFLYLSHLSQFIALGLCHTRRDQERRELLLRKIEELEATQRFEFPRPTTINNPFLRQYANIVDRNIAVALRNRFGELIKCCCLYESKRDACRGHDIALKLSLALDSFKKSAREAQALLNSHLDDKFANDSAAKALYATQTVDREIALQKTDVDRYLKNTTETVNYHLYKRTLEEVEMLVTDADRFLQSIACQIDDLQRAIELSEVAGHIVLLNNRYKYLVRLQDHAMEELKDVVPRPNQSSETDVSDVGEFIDRISLANIEKEEEDTEDNDEDGDEDDVYSEADDVDPYGLNDYSHALED